MRVTTLYKILPSIVTAILGVVLFSLINHHRITSMRRDQYHKIQALQRHLVLNDDVGFLWQPNQSIVMQEKDRWLNTKREGIPPEPPLTTDDYGFLNNPAAIEALKTNTPDIIGLGDSFIHNGANLFFRLFKNQGYFYYNMAMHRQCPPQYNAILTRYAIKHRPKHILYGVYVNDFEETEDFRQWKQSGLDWFTYHSGIWCGPPIKSNGGKQPSTAAKNPDANLGDVLMCILRANEICQSNGIEFTLMLIPSKDYVVSHRRSDHYETVFYDTLRNDASRAGIRVIDLRDVFVKENNPASLYWKSEGHWSYHGMDVAATFYLRALQGARVPEQ
jgi:hypothetical protein